LQKENLKPVIRWKQHGTQLLHENSANFFPRTFPYSKKMCLYILLRKNLQHSKNWPQHASQTYLTQLTSQWVTHQNSGPLKVVLIGNHFYI
jgi:hypothetical protein